MELKPLHTPTTQMAANDIGTNCDKQGNGLARIEELEVLSEIKVVYPIEWREMVTEFVAISNAVL